jgi:hypothetical protein
MSSGASSPRCLAAQRRGHPLARAQRAGKVHRIQFLARREYDER